MAEPAALLAQSMRPWVRDLHLYLMDHGGAIVRGYAMTAADVLAEDVDVFVVDDVTSFLSPRLLDEVRSRGVRTLGLYEREDGDAGRRALMALGVDAVLEADAPPELIVAELIRLRHTTTRSEAVDVAAPPPPAGGSGRVVAIGSAGGGAGATEVAVACAAAHSRRRRPVVLVDADDQSPGLAARLDLAAVPNLRSAVDATLRRGGTLRACVQRPPAGPPVVAGIATAADWDELRPAEVVQVLRDLAGTSTLVVANVGGRCEALPGYGAVARFGVARAVLGEADEVAVVAAASPTGVLRLVEWAAAARSIVEPGKLHVVLNRHTGNRFAAGELMAEVRQTLGPRSVSVLPFDRRVVRAEWECVPAPSGPFARGAATLTSWVASS